MCGRIAYKVLKKVFAEHFGAGRIDLDAVFPKANVAPTDLVAGVRLEGTERVASPYLWGFLPPNAPGKAFVSKYHTFNARDDSLETRRIWPKPFRTARCLVVASAWYEWEMVPGQAKKRPWTILPTKDELFVFAGLWGPWKDPETGHQVDTASIITTGATEAFLEIHDRMPVVLEEKDWGRWLDPAAPVEDLRRLLRPCPEEHWEAIQGGPDRFQVA